MNGLDTRRYEMLVRVRDFGSQHAKLFPSSTLGAQAFAALSDVVGELSEQGSTLLSGRRAAREGTTTKAVAREALREHLEAITRTARAMALDMPGVDDKFRPPRGSGDQRLIETARQFAHDAAPLANEFVKHAIPANFLDDLDSDIKALEEAIKVRESGQGTHVAARASINAAMEAALAAVRRLDAIVPNTVGNDAATLALWEHARRVDYPWSRRKVEEQEEAPAEPTASTTPAAAPVASPTTAIAPSGVTATA